MVYIEHYLIAYMRHPRFVDRHDAVIGKRQPRYESATANAHASGDYSEFVSSMMSERFLVQPLQHAASENIAAWSPARKFRCHIADVVRASHQYNAAGSLFGKFCKHLQYEKAAQAVADKVYTRCSDGRSET